MHQIIQWVGQAQSGFLKLLDQTKLPGTEEFIEARDVATVWDAIKRLCVRGAPAIGISAAYGCILGVQHVEKNPAAQSKALNATADYLATSRPTAVNLFWALERMKRVWPATPENLLAEALKIDRENDAMTRSIGEHGLKLIQEIAAKRAAQSGSNKPQVVTVHTHCNAGSLACGGIGTATAPVYLAHEKGIAVRVFADETRPLLQGSRLTAYEVQKQGVEVIVICDNMAAQVMREGKSDLVIVGADRIAANGDAANKIGTYGLAILARYHNIPFYVAAPISTFDLSMADGSSIPIEQRDAVEITHGMGKQTAPLNVKVYNPAFDVTPASLITGIITDRGIISPVNTQNVAAVLKK